MDIRFKDGTRFKCLGKPVEAMLFQNGKKAGWLLSFCLGASSAVIDDVLNEDNISDIGLEDNESTCGYGKLSYDSINSVRVEYDEGGAVAYIELRRGDCHG